VVLTFDTDTTKDQKRLNAIMTMVVTCWMTGYRANDQEVITKNKLLTNAMKKNQLIISLLIYDSYLGFTKKKES
jgi:predicted RNA polymerase sigma factor